MTVLAVKAEHSVAVATLTLASTSVEEADREPLTAPLRSDALQLLA